VKCTSILKRKTPKGSLSRFTAKLTAVSNQQKQPYAPLKAELKADGKLSLATKVREVKSQG